MRLKGLSIISLIFINLKTNLMSTLKEHKQFKNQLIIITIVCFSISWFIPEIIAFGIIFGLIALWNIFSYKENLKQYKNNL